MAGNCDPNLQNVDKFTIPPQPNTQIWLLFTMLTMIFLGEVVSQFGFVVLAPALTKSIRQ